eukprot:scaffold5517_cov116-Isochrysis_galbana.AAC.1
MVAGVDVAGGEVPEAAVVEPAEGASEVKAMVTGLVQVEVVTGLVQVEVVTGLVQVEVVTELVKVEMVTGLVKVEVVTGLVKVEVVTGLVKVAAVTGLETVMAAAAAGVRTCEASVSPTPEMATGASAVPGSTVRSMESSDRHSLWSRSAGASCQVPPASWLGRRDSRPPAPVPPP